MDPLTILAAFAPVLVDGAKGLVSRFLAPDEFKPATIEQYTSMRELDLKLFTAMNNAGGSNPTYQWVEAVKQLMRPAAAAIIFSTWAYLHLRQGNVTVTPETVTVDNMVSAVGFYLFGDRTLFYSRKARGNKQ